MAEAGSKSGGNFLGQAWLVILLALLYGLLMWRFSVWRTGRELDARSVPLKDARLDPVLDRMARALDVGHIPVNIYEVAPVNGLAAPDGRIFLTRGMVTNVADGGGALMNQAIHMVDLLIYLAGDVAEVSAYTATLTHPGLEVEDTVAASLRFVSGGLGLIEASTSCGPGLGGL